MFRGHVVQAVSIVVYDLLAAAYEPVRVPEAAQIQGILIGTYPPHRYPSTAGSAASASPKDYPLRSQT